MSTIAKFLSQPPNGFSTQIASATVASDALSVTLDSTTGLPTEGIGQFFKKDANGDLIAGSVEFVHWTNVSGSTITFSDTNDRGITGSDSGAQSYVADDYFEVWVSSYYVGGYGGLTNHNANGHLKSGAEIDDTTADHQYILGVSELTADRTITLPLLTGNDDFVFEDHTQTMTNKRITKRVTTTTDDATAVINIDTCDEYQLSAVANATEFTTTGTPTDGQTLIIRLKDAGVSKALTWTGFTAIGVTLPTATTAGKWHYIGCKYNSAATAWHAIAVVTQA